MNDAWFISWTWWGEPAGKNWLLAALSQTSTLNPRWPMVEQDCPSGFGGASTIICDSFHVFKHFEFKPVKTVLSLWKHPWLWNNFWFNTIESNFCFVFQKRTSIEDNFISAGDTSGIIFNWRNLWCQLKIDQIIVSTDNRIKMRFCCGDTIKWCSKGYIDISDIIWSDFTSNISIIEISKFYIRLKRVLIRSILVGQVD